MIVRNRFPRVRRRAAHALVVVLLIAFAGIAHAKDPEPCPEGFPATADLGIRNLDGNLTIGMKKVQNDPLVIRKVWRFFEEPKVTEIDPTGPSAGRLKEGDVLVAIDDALITTSEAGRKIGALDPDTPVKLTVRRDGKTLDVRVRPRGRCPDENLADAYRATRDRMRTPRAPRAPRAPRTPETPESMIGPAPLTPVAPAAPPERVSRRLASTRGWFGIGIDCDCKWVTVNDSMVWRSNDFPKIYLVEEGSPADKGGLKRGDVLTEINGVSLLSDQGGHMFGQVRPGHPVQWTVQREGETRTVTVVAGMRPGSEFTPSAEELERLRRQLEQIQITPEQRQQWEEMSQQWQLMPRQRTGTTKKQTLRWSGSVGEADVTVKGNSNVQVTTDEDTGEILISTGDATIRIKKSDVKEKKGSK